MYAGFIVEWQKGSTTHTHTICVHHCLCTGPLCSFSALLVWRGPQYSLGASGQSLCLLIFKYYSHFCCCSHALMLGLKCFVCRSFYFLFWKPYVALTEKNTSEGADHWSTPVCNNRAQELITLKRENQTSCSMEDDNMWQGAILWRLWPIS